MHIGNNAPTEFKKQEFGSGTHGAKLSAEARARRATKNARNRNRKHEVHPLHQHDMITPGSSKVVNTRLFLRGNRVARGIN